MAVIATRDRILTAAAGLYARQGYRGTSVRQLAEEAEANVASIHYHFGSKEGLFRELLRTTFEPINEERLRRLDEALEESGGAPLPVDALIRIFLAPAVRQLKASPAGLPCVLARIHHDPQPGMPEMLAELLQPCIARFLAEMARSAPHLDETDVLLRGHFMIGAMLHMLDTGRGVVAALSDGRIDVHDHEALLDELVTFCAAGFRHA